MDFFDYCLNDSENARLALERYLNSTLKQKKAPKRKKKKAKK